MKILKLRFIWTEYGFGKCDKYYKKIIDISELINMEIQGIIIPTTYNLYMET